MNTKKIALLLCSICALVFSGCAPKNDSKKDNYMGEEPVFTDIYEDDYAYMWRRDGFASDLNRMMFQSKNYAMLVESKTANIVGFSALKQEHNEVYDIDNIGKLSSKLEIKVSGNYYGTFTSASSRVISEGRHFNQWDNNALSFNGPEEVDDVLGRIEYTGTRNFIGINCGLGAVRSGFYGLRYTLNAENYTITEQDNVIKAIDENGNGFYVTTLDSSVIISNEGNKIYAEKASVELTTAQFSTFSIFLIPIYDNSYELLSNFNGVKEVQVIAKTFGGSSLPAIFDEKTNTFVVDIKSIATPAVYNNGSYDIVRFEIQNNVNSKVRPIIRVMKNTNVSITGVSGVLRDFVTHEQTGEQVQITKNWHQLTQHIDDPLWSALSKDHQGPWCYGIFAIDLGPYRKQNREYCQIYGRWGTSFAVSHGQLCLIGWGGSKNELWDQSALGSWGESVTYDPDCGLGRSLIDDVRPFSVLASTGSYRQYDWSGNVGGADFLSYSSSTGNKPIINQRVTYRAVGPNVTEVSYNGYTADNKIKTTININMGRTDDIVRTIYNISYTFLEDVEFTSLSLFKLCADGYADNSFSKYCYGDIDGVYAKDQNALKLLQLSDSKVETAKNEQFFYGLYNSSNEDEMGDPMFVVRNYDAKINGKQYNKTPYRLVSTQNSGHTQMGCEVCLPGEQGKSIKHGSKVNLTIEYDILPDGGRVNGTQSYYGQSDYIRLNASDMGSFKACQTQAKYGKVSVSASKGKVLNDKPVTIEAEKDMAEFVVTGGLGYVPVIIKNVKEYRNYTLEKKVNGEWVKVDQHAKDEKDFYQVVYDEKTENYEFAFNVKNDIKKITDFGQTNEYRFHKSGN